MKTFLLLLHVALPLIGIADASYLAYEELQGIVPPCGSGFSCGEVLSSPYAHIGPVPLYALGLLFYLTLFILGVATILELDIKGFVPKKLQSFATLPQLFTTLATLGGLFSLYLVFIMAFVIKGWCLYCLISAATSMTLFFVSWKYFSMTQKKPHLLLKTISHTIFNFLYTQLLKPVLFLFDPETIHTAFTKAGYILGQNSLTRSLTNWIFSYNSPTTAVTFNGISFPNKIGLCAGFDYNGEKARILGPVGFGFHTIGTVTAQPYQGNPKPRLGRLPDSKALIVNKGLKSLGAKTIIAKLSGIHFSVPVGISIASTNTHFDSDHEQVMDVIKSFVLFEKSQVHHSYYELNISCPNTFGGEPFTTPNRLEQLLSVIDTLELSKPLYIKMPIDQSEKETLALLRVSAAHTVQGVIFGNLTKDKNNPAVTDADRKIWKQRKGNLSGQPTFERSNNLIKLTKKNFKNRFTIVGCGGIFDTKTAQTKLDAGADLLQLITGMIYNGPQTIGTINRELDSKSA